MRSVANDRRFVPSAKEPVGEREVSEIVELMKRQSQESRNDNFYFWRSSDGREVDLIVERGGEILNAIEIKSSTIFQTSFFDTLNKFAHDIGLDSSKLQVIYAGTEDINTSKGAVKSIF